MTALTKNQTEAMEVLAQYAGQTVSCLTSGYTANVASEAVRASVDTFSSAALRGLEARGLITGLRSYWKGATFTVVAQ